MNINHLVLVMGLLLTAVGGYFSIIGLATIFAGAYWSVVVMATTLELSKVVAASWIYRSWSIAPLLIRTYMVMAVVVLVFITSLGIFGYLSKAHIEQTINAGGNNAIQIENLERQIQNELRKTEDATQVISQLDSQVQTLIDYDRIRGPSGSIAIREGQSEERESLNETINQSYDSIEKLQQRLAPLKSESLALEAEIGPLKYIAELIYGTDNAADYFDTAVRWIILLLVVVFDPLAIVMILAGNVGIVQTRPKVIIQERAPEAMVMEDINSVINKASPIDRDGHGLDG